MNTKLAVEETPATAPEPAAVPRAALLAEVIGYAGGALVIVAGTYLAGELWRNIPTGAALALAAVASVALGAAGAALRTSGSPPARRLRSVLWLLSTASLAAFMGILGNQVWQLSPAGTTMAAAAAAGVYGAAQWWRTRAALQHLAVFASAAVLVGTAVAQLGLGNWALGLGIWTLSALWGGAVIRGYLLPRGAGYFAAGFGLLVGIQFAMDVPAGHLLALATVAGLLAGGVLLREVWLAGLGAVSVLLVVPQTAERFLPESAAAPLAVFVAGAVLVGSAVWLAKRRARSG
ncbi:MAG TPA: hypothetical protein VGQ05_17465 [Streptosporangiaceae bacterium]|nr:hypothetical protein [Streptosporangiaceae bacterium]